MVPPAERSVPSDRRAEDSARFVSLVLRSLQEVKYRAETQGHDLCDTWTLWSGLAERRG